MVSWFKKLFLAFDLKVDNIVLGISFHSGKHVCMYCEGEMEVDAGKPRTFRSLGNNKYFINDNTKMRDGSVLILSSITTDQQYFDFEKNGGKMKEIK